MYSSCFRTLSLSLLAMFPSIDTTVPIVEALQNELDPYSAAPDGEIPTRIWSELLISGYIPEPLIMQQFKPIYKKGDSLLLHQFIKRRLRVFSRNILSDSMKITTSSALSENQLGF